MRILYVSYPQYFQVFFGVLFALLLVWSVALCLVHNSSQRRRAIFRATAREALLPSSASSLPPGDLQLPLSAAAGASAAFSSSASLSTGQRRFIGSINLSSGSASPGFGLGLGMGYSAGVAADLPGDRERSSIARGKLPVVEVGPTRVHGKRMSASLVENGEQRSAGMLGGGGKTVVESERSGEVQDMGADGELLPKTSKKDSTSKATTQEDTRQLLVGHRRSSELILPGRLYAGQAPHSHNHPNVDPPEDEQEDDVNHSSEILL